MSVCDSISESLVNNSPIVFNYYTFYLDVWWNILLPVNKDRENLLRWGSVRAYLADYERSEIVGINRWSKNWNSNNNRNISYQTSKGTWYNKDSLDEEIRNNVKSV